MAWPLSRLVNWVSNNVPVIGAAALDSIQDWIIALSSGTVSVLSLVVDGAGGQAVSGPAGTVTVGGSIGTTAAGDGVMYRELCPFATGVIKHDATILRGPNVATAIGGDGPTTATGLYTVTLRGCPTWAKTLADNTVLNLPLVVQVMSTGTLEGYPTIPQWPFKTTVGGVPVVQFQVSITNPSGTAVNQGFSFVIFP